MTIALRIYVASSWRNKAQPEVVERLRLKGHEVYDFRNPPGRTGFQWRQAGNFAAGGPLYYMVEIERNAVARAGFEADKAALDWCNVCVLVLPCGRSAHLEAGYAAGQGKTVLFLLSEDGWEPELMYLLGNGFCATIEDLEIALGFVAHDDRQSFTTRGHGRGFATGHSAKDRPQDPLQIDLEEAIEAAKTREQP